MNTNLIAPFLVSKYVGYEMLKNNKGKIINISSTNGINTFFPTSIDYDASKAGIISLTHNFALELSPIVRVNAICPGWINTNMNKDLSIEFKNKETEKILLNRFAAPREIANVIYFLSTEEASYINDSVIKVDGGVNHD